MGRIRAGTQRNDKAERSSQMLRCDSPGKDGGWGTPTELCPMCPSYRALSAQLEMNIFPQSDYPVLVLGRAASVPVNGSHDHLLQVVPQECVLGWRTCLSI